MLPAVVLSCQQHDRQQGSAAVTKVLGNPAGTGTETHTHTHTDILIHSGFRGDKRDVRGPELVG